MNTAKAGDMKIAIRVAYETFAPLEAGVKSFVRIIRPETKTYRLIFSSSSETEVTGYSETVKISADLVFGDAACEYLYSLAESAGRGCKTEIFLYRIDDAGSIPGSFFGKRYPVTAAVTKISGETENSAPFYGFEADLYINGDGITEERVITG
jgi:hypothetical protein